MMDQCSFLKESVIALKGAAVNRVPEKGTATRAIFMNALKIARSISLICTSEIHGVLAAARVNDTIDQIAFLTSQQDFPSVWNALERSNAEKVDFGYTLDGDESFYRPRTGVSVPSNLRSNQQWVWRTLRALYSSGIMDLWTKWERMSAFVRVSRLAEKWARVKARPVPISLKNSWFLAVLIQGLLPALALSGLVALAERCAFRRKRQSAVKCYRSRICFMNDFPSPSFMKKCWEITLEVEHEKGITNDL